MIGRKLPEDCKITPQAQIPALSTKATHSKLAFLLYMVLTTLKRYSAGLVVEINDVILLGEITHLESISS